ncbi:hypothetical protein [Nocardia sp. NPDC049149]|uniref:hypothetical protein n=1 Tax=Nocardia sp. NPDC049149 TaxID=3364315 RepID=UPI0037122BE8
MQQHRLIIFTTLASGHPFMPIRPFPSTLLAPHDRRDITEPKSTPIRKVVLYELMSLDGFADDPGRSDWMGGADERLVDNLGRVIADQDTVMLGRRTFDAWSVDWPESTMQPFADMTECPLPPGLLAVRSAMDASIRPVARA